jgi:hypothetical protein
MARHNTFHMKIVGNISSEEEASQLQSAVKLFVIENRVKELATVARGEQPMINKQLLAIVLEL